MTLTVHLGLLEGAGLIQLASVHPEVEYLFRHVLVKDAAYQSLVKSNRRHLHRAVGETLEALYPEAAASPLPGEIYHLLAFHFAEAGDAARALRYFRRAGQAAAAVYANQEAAAHFSQAIAAAGPLTLPAAEVNDLYTRLGRVQELSGDYDGALSTYARLEALGQARGEQSLVLAALIAQAVVRAVPSSAANSAQAEALSAHALQLARDLGDRPGEVRALWTQLLLGLATGDAARAIAAGEAALASAGPLELSEQTAFILNDLGRAYAGAGQVNNSLTTLTRARELWRRLNNSPMLAETLNNLGAGYYSRGEFAPALATLDEAWQVSQAAGNAWGQSYGLMLRSYVLLELGQVQAALDSLALCLKLANEGGFIAPLVEGRAALALIYAYLGQLAEARSEMATARQIVSDRAPFILPGLTILDALILVWTGQFDEAEALLDSHEPQAVAGTDLTQFVPMFWAMAEGQLGLTRRDFARAVRAPATVLAHAEQAGVHRFHSDLALLHARGLVGLGRLDEAEAVLAKALAGAEARHTRWQFWSLLAAQAEIAQQRGAARQALRLWRRAQAEVEALAAQLTDPALRAGLWNRPDVRAIMAAIAHAEDAPQ